jgi:hypothetical protein
MQATIQAYAVSFAKVLRSSNQELLQAITQPPTSTQLKPFKTPIRRDGIVGKDKGASRGPSCEPQALALSLPTSFSLKVTRLTAFRQVATAFS